MSPAAKLTLSLISTAAVLSMAIPAQLSNTQTGGPIAETNANPPVPVPEVHTLEGVTVSGALDRSTILENGDRRVRMELTVSSDRTPSAINRSPTDVVVILDRSGSMTGEKLLDAKNAARELISLLGEEDRFSLITYADSATVDIALEPATEQAKHQWMGSIDRVGARGGTHMQAGLSTALNTWERRPGRVMRHILISDGLPDRQDGLMDLASRSAAAEIPLTTVGIGLDYDEALMTRLADAGTGNFYWTQRGNDLATAFSAEFDEARETVASQVAVQFSSPNGTQLTGTAGYPLNQNGFDIGGLVAGQTRKVWVTLELPSDYQGGTQPGSFDLSWMDVHGGSQTANIVVPPVTVTRSVAAYRDSFDVDNWERAVLNEEYNVLQTAMSQEVQAGDCDGAIELIADYRGRNGALNESVGSTAVADNLAALDALEAQVKAQFEGDNQQARQNFWAKTVAETAHNGRRNRK